ncbi:MAG: lamin tail domain-containing protein, partial [Rhodothermia bacterium]|nr:lamin tail domain-containing protein [Rhodothermia bacterium]
MRSTVAIAVLGFLAASRPCLAQLAEDFDDGDLSANPRWFGDVDRFVLEDTGSGYRLRANGLAQSDTLVLRTESTQTFGTWELAYGYRDGKPTSFNHARLILSGPQSEDDESVGYALQLGSNDGSIRLYSFRGGISDRQLLRSSDPDVLAQDSLDVSLRIERNYGGQWTAFVDNIPVLTHQGPANFSETSEVFTFWIKHTASRSQSHWFDDILVRGAIASDSIPPSAIEATAVDRNSIAVRFDEPLADAEACRLDAYRLLPVEQPPTSADCLKRPYTDSLLIHSTKSIEAGDELQITGVADPSGNVTTSHTISVDVSAIEYLASPGSVVINEIDFAPMPAESEFVELVNRSNRSVDLSALELTDGGTSTTIVPATLFLDPGEFAVITRDTVAFRLRFATAPAIQPSRWPSLNNSGDLVAIVVGRDTIDAVRYQPEWASGSGSLERVNPVLPSNFRGNWESSLDSRGGTPGAQNSIFAIDTTNPEVAWAGQKSGAQNFVHVQFSESIPVDSLERGDFALNGIVATELLPGHDRYGDSIVLRFDAVSAGDLSVRNLHDVAGNTSPLSSVRLRLQPYSGSFVINELMYDPIADAFDGKPDQTEFVELRSLSAEPLDLSSCVVSGPVDEHGDRDLLNLESADAALRPNGFMTIVARGNGQTLLDAFPDIPQDAIVRQVRESSLRLVNTGTTVRIECPDAGVVDSVSYDPAWHNDTVPFHAGRSLERIDPVAPGYSPLNWSTSVAPFGASPGRQNSIAPPPTLLPARKNELIITEVMYEPRSDPPSPQFEYVEILNRSDRQIDINGFSITTNNDGRAPTSVRIAYGPTVLASQQYAVVANGPSADSVDVGTY